MLAIFRFNFNPAEVKFQTSNRPCFLLQVSWLKLYFCKQLIFNPPACYYAAIQNNSNIEIERTLKKESKAYKAPHA